MGLLRKINQKGWIIYCICFCIALLLEVFLFNFKTFESMGYQSFTVGFDAVQEMVGGEDGFSFHGTQAYGHITSQVPIHNISFVTNPIEECLITQFLPNGQVLGENQERLLEVRLAYDGKNFDNAQKEAIPLYSSENDIIRIPRLKGIYFLDVLFDNPYENDICLHEIRCNERIPFHFSFLRFLMLVSFLALIVAFRRKSILWKVKMREGRKWNYLIPVFCVLVVSIFLSLFYLNNITSANIPGVNSYGKLAEALASGSVKILDQPDASLLQLDNPYDVYERAESGANYLWDFAYYKGSYYVYFGIVPCLLFFLPYYIFTGSIISYSLVFSIFVAGFVISLALCLKAFCRRYFQEISLGTYLLLLLSSAFGSGLLYVAGHATTYGIPQVSAITFVLLGLYFYFKASEGEKIKIRYLILGSLFVALSAGCRPHIVLYGLLAFPILKDKMLSKNTGKAWISFVSPLLLIAIGLMLYNVLRFGSPFDFGASYNLTMHNVYGAHTTLGDILAALFYYLVTVPKLTGDFPVFDRVSPSFVSSRERFTYTDGGFLWFVPILLLGFFYFSKQGRKKERLWQVVCILIGFVLLGIDASSLASRYAFDFLPVLLMASWGPFVRICESVKGKKSTQVVRSVLVIVCIYIMVVAILGYFTMTKGGGLMVDAPEVFYRIRKWLLFWT